MQVKGRSEGWRTTGIQHLGLVTLSVRYNVIAPVAGVPDVEGKKPT
jgi:hypothetical protein